MTAVNSVCIVTSVHPDFDARVWRHATGLAALGIKVHLVCPWDVKQGEVIEDVHLHPFRRVTHRLARPLLIPLRMMPTVLSLLSAVRLVHFHDIDILPYMALLALFKPVVYHVHENYPEEMLVRSYRLLPNAIRPFLFHLVRTGQWIFSNVIRNVVLVVPSQRDDFRGSRLRIICMWNYASRDLGKGRREDYRQRKNVISFPGSQYHENGSLILLHIASEVKKRVPDVIFRVTDRFHGAESFRQTFLYERNRLQLQDTVGLVPNVPAPRIMDELNLARVGVNVALPVPKSIRAMPNKLFEYMAAGIPVVSFDYPYPRSVIEDARCGALVKPGHIIEFADRIVELLGNADVASQLGDNGARSFSEKYNWDAQLVEMLEYYHRVVG